MFEKVGRMAGDAGELLDAEGELLLRRFSRLLIWALLFWAIALVGVGALVGVAAAAVVALAGVLGAAGALAIVAGPLLGACVIGGAVAWQRALRAARSIPEDPSDRAVTARRDQAMSRLMGRDKPAEERSGLGELLRGDPVVIAAIVGAVVALVGPRRILRVAGAATAGAGAFGSLSAVLRGVTRAFRKPPVHHADGAPSGGRL